MRCGAFFPHNFQNLFHPRWLIDLEALHVRLQSAGVHPQPRFARDAAASTAKAAAGFPRQINSQVLVVDVLNAAASRT